MRVCVCVERTDFNKDTITELEKWIDELDAGLPPLRTFILPVYACVCMCVRVCVCVCVCGIACVYCSALLGAVLLYEPDMIVSEFTHTKTHPFSLSLSLSHTHTLTHALTVRWFGEFLFAHCSCSLSTNRKAYHSFNRTW